MKNKLKIVPGKVFKRKKEEEIDSETSLAIPRITNETVAEHREEVLKGARKYIYPLQHSKHKIVLITTTIVIAATIGFLSYCVIGLYKLHEDNAFLYRITQVVPFPVARTGKTFIAYENYLFELRHSKHYYQVQLKQEFKSADDQQLLQVFRKKALQQVIDDAYIKKLAADNKISVSGKEVQERIQLVKNQNRLGDNNRVFEDVLKDYWGWSTHDFERSLRQTILAEKVVARLDSGTTQRANEALEKLKNGAVFADLAKQVSDDQSTKSSGGEYGIQIDKNNRDIPPQVIDALYKLKPGQVSGIINTGSGLEIVMLKEKNGDKVTASHMVFTFKEVSTFLNEIKDKQKVRTYIKV